MESTEIAKHLRQVDIFQSSPDSVLDSLAQVIKIEQVPSGTQIIKKGDEGNCMYVMTDGKVKIHDGQHTIVELDGHQVFGELALLNTEPRTASVTTVQDSILLRLDQRDFYSVISSSLDVTQGIIRMLTKRLQNQNESIIQSLKEREKELVKLVEERTIDLKREKQKLEGAYQEITAKNSSLSAANEEIAEKTRNITSSINYAKRIQDALLPQLEVVKKGFPESFIFFRPRDIVSGDAYWYGEKDDYYIFACIDCTGHGVPGALMSMIGNTLLNQIINIRGIIDPGRALNQLHSGVRKALKQDIEDSRSRDGMDLALIAYNHRSKELLYSGANRPLLIIDPSGGWQEIKPTKFPIGGMQKEDERNYETHKFYVQNGTVIYLSTDGYADQFGGPANRKFMKKHLRQIFLDNFDKDMQVQESILNKALTDWMGDHNQIDDILVTGFRLR